MGGPVDPRLDPPPLSRCLVPLWETFLTLSCARRSGMGPHALTLTDIEAWCRLTGVRLSPWELDTLLALDAVALSVTARTTSK